MQGVVILRVTANGKKLRNCKILCQYRAKYVIISYTNCIGDDVNEN